MSFFSHDLTLSRKRDEAKGLRTDGVTFNENRKELTNLEDSKFLNRKILKFKNTVEIVYAASYC